MPPIVNEVEERGVLIGHGHALQIRSFPVEDRSLDLSDLGWKARLWHFTAQG